MDYLLSVGSLVTATGDNEQSSQLLKSNVICNTWHVVMIKLFYLTGHNENVNIVISILNLYKCVWTVRTQLFKQ